MANHEVIIGVGPRLMGYYFARSQCFESYAKAHATVGLWLINL